MSQAQRDTVMKRFRSGNLQMLIATDVAARGIDVNDVDSVINYDVPQDIEYYVHRIGCLLYTSNLCMWDIYVPQ